MLKKCWKLIRNKYFIATAVFAVWIVFIDDSNLIHQSQLQQELNKVKKEKAFYMKEIKSDSTNYARLKTDKNMMEAYGREKYLMKRDNEDIFLIVIEEEKED